VDSLGAKEGSARVIRGGGWSDDAAYCRSANRGTSAPTYRTPNFGLRLALSPSGATPEAVEDK
jgi:formylglycine-generating enzyme required for sulfatase activity